MRILVALLVSVAVAIANPLVFLAGRTTPPPAIQFINVSTKAEVNLGNLTLNAPSSPQVGDIWIAAVATSDGSTLSLSGWTEIFSATAPAVYAWWVRYSGSTPNLVVTASTGTSAVGAIAVFRNCNETTPINVVGSVTGSADASIEISGITPSAPNCMLVIVDGATDDNARTTPPAGFSIGFEEPGGATENCFFNILGNPDSSLALFYKTHTSGATGDFTDTMAAGDGWKSGMFALQTK